jgi:protein-S-isoprenylcysteine O-methyltransferase Ste14
VVAVAADGRVGPLTADRVTAENAQPQVSEEGDRLLEIANGDAHIDELDRHRFYSRSERQDRYLGRRSALVDLAPAHPISAASARLSPRCTRRCQAEAVRAVEVVLAVAWAAFWLYWLTAAFSMKRGRVPWSRELGIRVVVVAVVIVLVRFGVFRHQGRNTEPWRAGLGLALLALGLGFAIWARIHIGRNWGMPMTQKDEPELVSSGPYRLVRHPIYSGILVAVVGTAVALAWIWLVAALLVGIYFGYSATVEERYLAERFPDAYRAYRRSTKMLIPFLF